jgi:hypothetical protein
VKKRLMTLGVLTGLLFCFSTSAYAISYISYTGSLSPYGGGIIATDGWNSAETVFAWIVTEVGSQGGSTLWEYDYTFTVPTKNISHIIIEVSPDVPKGTDPSITGITVLSGSSSGGVDSYGPGGPNPNMPGTMQGIKFDGAETTTLSFSFETTRAPVWGDFYAKDGQDDSIWVTAWNAGFTDTDPTEPPDNGSLDFHILRPDTQQTPVPEPGTLVLLGAGLLGLWLVRRKK